MSESGRTSTTRSRGPGGRWATRSARRVARLPNNEHRPRQILKKARCTKYVIVELPGGKFRLHKGGEGVLDGATEDIPELPRI